MHDFTLTASAAPRALCLHTGSAVSDHFTGECAA